MSVNSTARILSTARIANGFSSISSCSRPRTSKAFMRRTPRARRARRGASGSPASTARDAPGRTGTAVHRPSSSACSRIASSEARPTCTPQRASGTTRTSSGVAGAAYRARSSSASSSPARASASSTASSGSRSPKCSPARITRGSRSGADSSRSRLASTRSVRRRDMRAAAVGPRSAAFASLQTFSGRGSLAAGHDDHGRAPARPRVADQRSRTRRAAARAPSRPGSRCRARGRP